MSLSLTKLFELTELASLRYILVFDVICPFVLGQNTSPVAARATPWHSVKEYILRSMPK